MQTQHSLDAYRRVFVLQTRSLHGYTLFYFLLVLLCFSDSFKSVCFCDCFHDHKFSNCVVLSNKIKNLSRCQQKLNLHYTSIFWFANSDQHCREKTYFARSRKGREMLSSTSKSVKTQRVLFLGSPQV